MLNAAAARAACPGLEFEDAVQEGLVGLFCAVRTYESGRGASFSTYAAACVHNAVNSAARAARCRKHEVLNRAVSIEAAPPAQEKARRHAQRKVRPTVPPCVPSTRGFPRGKKVCLPFL